MAGRFGTLIDPETGKAAEGAIEVVDDMTVRLNLPAPAFGSCSECNRRMPKKMLAVAATKIRRRSNFPQARHLMVQNRLNPNRSFAAVGFNNRDAEKIGYLLRRIQ